MAVSLTALRIRVIEGNWWPTSTQCQCLWSAQQTRCVISMMEASFHYTDTGEARQGNLLCPQSHSVIAVSENSSSGGLSPRFCVLLHSYFASKKKKPCVFPPSPRPASIIHIIMWWFPNETPIPPHFSAHSLWALLSARVHLFCLSLVFSYETHSVPLTHTRIMTCRRGQHTGSMCLLWREVLKLNILNGSSGGVVLQLSFSFSLSSYSYKYRNIWKESIWVIRIRGRCCGAAQELSLLDSVRHAEKADEIRHEPGEFRALSEIKKSWDRGNTEITGTETFVVIS